MSVKANTWFSVGQEQTKRKVLITLYNQNNDNINENTQMSSKCNENKKKYFQSTKILYSTSINLHILLQIVADLPTLELSCAPIMSWQLYSTLLWAVEGMNIASSMQHFPHHCFSRSWWAPLFPLHRGYDQVHYSRKKTLSLSYLLWVFFLIKRTK